MEKEELQIVEPEDEMMSSEAFNVAADLRSTVSYGESLGVFLPQEAAEWYAGIDACVKVSHLRGLMPYLNKVIASGEARLRQVAKAADSELLTASEQHGYMNQADSLTYRAKGQLVKEIEKLVQDLKGLRARLLAILGKKNITLAEQSALIDKFYSASANSKSGVVQDAESLKVVESKEPEPMVADKTQPAEQKHSVAQEVVKPIEEVKKDPRAECLDLVEHYLKHDQFRQAADLVEISLKHFHLMEYRALLKRIEKARLAKEIPELRTLLQAA